MPNNVIQILDEAMIMFYVIIKHSNLQNNFILMFLVWELRFIKHAAYFFFFTYTLRK